MDTFDRSEYNRPGGARDFPAGRSDMMRRECTLYGFTMHYLRLLVEGIDDAQMAVQPAPQINHPAWLLGHLAIAADYVPLVLGEKMSLPEAWHKQLFGPGSLPTTERDRYPSKAELVASLERLYERNLQLVAAAPEATLAAPHKIEFFLPLLPTVGDMVAHLMSTHVAFHLGQLSTWRRLMGLPGVLKFPA